MTYLDIVQKHKDKIEVFCFHVINDKTLRQSYSIYTNLHIDLGICEGKQLKHWTGTSKSEFRKQVGMFKRILHKQVKLHKTDNSLGYTRLIYKLM